MIVLPDFPFGGMENWGLILYRDSKLQDDGKRLLGHEIAHQWFGNLITMNWWGDVWLKEGFATYLEYKIIDDNRHDFHIDEKRFLTGTFKKAMDTDATTSESHPLFVNVTTRNEIDDNFGNIPYHKGACVIRMLANIVGQTIIRKSLVRYFKKFSYKNTHRFDILNIIQELVELESSLKDSKNNTVNIKNVMIGWIEQAGFPLVSVDRNYTDGSVTFSQRRFTFDTNDNDKLQDVDQQWHIIIRYQLGPTKINGTFWLTPNETGRLMIKLDSKSWIVINYGVYGFFKSNYDDYNWNLLAEQYKSDPTVIESNTLDQLFNDACKFAKMNRFKGNGAVNNFCNLRTEKPDDQPAHDFGKYR